MNNNTLKSIFSYFIGNMSSKLLSVLLIPIYAYFVSVEDLGDYDYFIALLNIIVPIAYLNVWDAELKYLIGYEKLKERKYFISNAFFIMLCGQLTLAIIVAILFLFNLVSAQHITISYVYFSGFGWLFYFQYLCRGFKDNKLYVKSSLLSTFLHIILIIILVIGFKLGFIGLVISDVCTNIIIILLFSNKIHFVKFLDVKYVNKKLVFEIIKFSFPLTVNIISVWMTSGISKIIVTRFVSSFANGIYSFGNRFAVIITTIGTVVNMALLEEAYSYKSIEEFRDNTKSLISRMAKIYISIILILIPSIKILFDVALKSTDYYLSIELVPAFMILSFISIISGIIGNAFTVTGKTNRLFICSLTGAVVNILVGLLLIRHLSYYGVLIAQLLGNITIILMKAAFAYKEAKLRVRWNILFIGCVTCMIVGYISYQINFYWNMVSFVAICFFIFLWNKKDIMVIIAKIKHRKED